MPRSAQNVRLPQTVTRLASNTMRPLCQSHLVWFSPLQKCRLNSFVLADDECCAGTLKYFGSNSTMSSRNCFCVPSVYERFTAGLVDVAVGEYFGVCT